MVFLLLSILSENSMSVWQFLNCQILTNLALVWSSLSLCYFTQLHKLSVLPTSSPYSSHRSDWSGFDLTTFSGSLTPTHEIHWIDNAWMVMCAPWWVVFPCNWAFIVPLYVWVSETILDTFIVPWQPSTTGPLYKIFWLCDDAQTEILSSAHYDLDQYNVSRLGMHGGQVWGQHLSGSQYNKSQEILPIYILSL